jgi:glyoxalase family protein
LLTVLVQNSTATAAAVQTRLALSGLHHVTAISADAPQCEDFYTRVLGLRPIAPRLGHELGDHELAFAGGPAVLTFAIRPGERPGRVGSGAAHTVLWRAGDPTLATIWERLDSAGVSTEAATAVSGQPAVRFRDPEGLAHELAAAPAGATDALSLAGVRAHCPDYVHTSDILAGRMDFAVVGARTLGVGEGNRAATYVCDPAAGVRARLGAGMVDHVAWECQAGAQRIWRHRVIGMGVRAEPVRERDGLRSMHFTEPSGVGFEVVTEL